MTNYFSRPFYYNNNITFKLKQAFGFGVFVFFFLWFFNPFEISSLPQDLTLIALSFGCITVAVMLVLNVLIPSFQKKLFDGEYWTLGKEILWTLVNITLIGLGNFLFFSMVWLDNFSWEALIWFQIVTFVIGSIPVCLVLMWKENRDAQKYRLASAKMNAKHEDLRQANNSVYIEIEIVSQNSGESFCLNSNQLMFIQAADNYLEVNYWNKQKLSKNLIRNTLTNMEKALLHCPQFFRCHKSYLINLDVVDFVSGNAQGYRLHLKQAGVSVPVSRKHNAFIKNLFTGKP